MMQTEFTARANGRVNLIGEHTDYNGGWVLPTVIPQFTQVSVSRRGDDVVSVQTKFGYASRTVETSFQLGEERPLRTWIDYIQGATSILLASGFELGGFNARIESSVPVGSGLSSSAALEISLLKALREAF